MIQKKEEVFIRVPTGFDVYEIVAKFSERIFQNFFF